MLKVNKDSWHYKVWRFVWADEGFAARHLLPKWLKDSKDSEDAFPKSLCPYFWSVVLAIPALPLLSMLFWTMELIRIIAVTIIWHSIRWILKAGVSLIILAGAGVSKMRGRPNVKKGKKAGPRWSFFWEFLKGVKSKACPLIQLDES